MSFTIRQLLLASTLLIAATASAQLGNNDCVSCHDQKLDASVHAPLGCVDCHSDISAVPHEPKPAKPDCASCHPDEVAAWRTSRHAKALAAGNTHAASCLSCHGG